MKQFVHLHNHTHYSLLDGACRIHDLVEYAKRFNMPAIAITDHGNMFGAVEFYQEVLKHGIRPIIGIEAYVAPKSRFERKDKTRSGSEPKSFHLILLAKNLTGYKNLMKLSSIGYVEGFYYKPRIDKDVIKKYSDGLIVMSACIKGEVAQKIIQDDYEGAKEVALFYREIFKDDFYLEVQNHGLPEELKVIKYMKEISKELDIPMVATNDTHYLKKEHAEAHDILLCLQTNKDIEDQNRLKFSTDQNYFKSPDEMMERFADIPQAIDTSIEIAEKCNLVLNFKSIHLPHFKIPEEERVYSLDEYLKIKAEEGLKRRYETVTQEIEKRLAYELSVIKRMGYAGYFLIVADFIAYAKSRGIPVGPGRGSAAGSIVSYVLGITNVDPLRYGLMFERFLNPERVSMPDIDIDFCYERREEIIDYVKNKYGENSVTQIITFGSMNARAVIRDVGRVLKIPYGEVDRIAKLIPHQIGMTIDNAYNMVPEFREICEKDQIHKKLLNYSRILEGLARHASTHAAGVVIAPGELTDYLPLFKSTQGEITTQYDMKSVEQIGLLKMDFLGLRTLTVIDHTIKMLKDRGVEIDIDEIPYDDKDTYELFSRGETVGIFQFESSGMRDYLKKLRPESIEELTAMNALYRPGPMEWIDDYINRKTGKTKIEYIHPRLEPILKETHGIIVYQEQVMQIAIQLAGFTPGKADLLRKAMGKKRADLMQQQRSEFISGAVANGIPEKSAQQIYDLIDRFAGYGFNKSHATCYSIIAYQTAYLKAKYPLEFMAANLTSEMGNSDRVVILIEECKRMNIEVFPPDVNTSRYNFVVEDGGIRFGLGAIKNVGRGAIESIIEGRKRVKKFETIFDLCKNSDLRLVNKKVLESLVQSGAMDSLEGTRAQKMAVIPKAVSLAQSYQQTIETGQTNIFGESVSDKNFYPPLPRIGEWSQSEKLKREKELLGFYISGNPLNDFREEVEAFTSPKPENLFDTPSGQNVSMCGIVTDVKKMFDRKDKPMAFFTLDVFSYSIRAIVFSKVFEKFKDLIKNDNKVVVRGRLDRKDGNSEVSILVSEIVALEDAMEKLAKRLSINISTDKITDEEINRIEMILSKYAGSCPVFFNIKSKIYDEEILVCSRKYKVKADHSMVHDLKQVLGKENVWIEG